MTKGIDMELFVKKEKVGLVLDIGNEAVKAALFEKMEMAQKSLLPSEIYFLGGASLLPGLPNILKDGDGGEFSFESKPKVIAFKNPQHIPTLLPIAAQT